MRSAECEIKREVDVERRQLKFDSLNDAVCDAENLLAEGYEKTGNWTLSQVCDHLTDWLTFPLDGFPKAPLPIAAMLWTLKVTIGKRKLQTYLTERSFPAGKPTMPQSIHPPGDDAVAVAKYKAAAKRFMEHSGPYLPSPLFGAYSNEDAAQLQCVHAAHHLSFLVPKI